MAKRSVSPTCAATARLSVTAHLRSVAIHALFAGWRSGRADALQAQLDDLRGAVQKLPLITALEVAIARCNGDTGRVGVCPPPVEPTADQTAGRVAGLEGRDIRVLGLAEAATV